ncbi:NACHT domain-containing protein [Corallococcus sp. bb12-1]|uniref:NACHT domain-containing protein n=1 Tax=Corallococcus sp. bb12-1 TaxID=2996784 RepID=UPI00226EB362|nr:NACHT domain-containing protein [Corallococcus sp. bb12-1]MCY1043480.1 NACHT domain-containing protein [Corallococcus sp. bb12-1]
MSDDGTDVPRKSSPVLAVIQVRVGLTQDEASSMVLKARLFAGIQYISQQLPDAEMREMGTGNWRLSLTGAEGPELARQAFDAARMLRERILVDLSLPSRIAVHAAVVGDEAARREQALERCEQLQAHAPENTIAVSPDVYRVLLDDVRKQLSPPAPITGEETLAALFPPGASVHGESLWEELLRDLTRPAVRRLHYVGFRLQKKEPPSLDLFDVFVMPSVEVRRKSFPDSETLSLLSSDFLRGSGSEASLGHLTESVRQATPSLPSQRMTFQEAFQQHRSLVVLGDPGSGKTTLLRWLALVGAGGPLAMHAALGNTAPPLPLLVSVGHLAQVRASLGDDTSVTEALSHLLHQRGVGRDEDSLRRFLELRLEQGDCLVLLDGLDEVRSETSPRLMRWLEDFATHHPRNRFIASARRVGYLGLTLPDAVEVELGPFEDEQVRCYLRSFYRAYRHWEEGQPDDVAADRESEQLLTALFASQRLHELSRSPLILASLALIHRAEGQLPRHRVQAYEILARTLCETWGQARRLTASDTEAARVRYEEEAIPILGRLALEMHRQWPNGVAPEGFIIATLATTLQERDGVSREEAERSAQEFLHRAGKDVQILLERGPMRWGFLHLTFQEFFAAAGLHASESFAEEGMKHLFDPRWEELLRLGVGYMALVQKRPEGAKRFIQQVMNHQEEGIREVLTRILRKQIPMAALLATEAGDALPVPLQNRIAGEFSRWLCAMPRDIGEIALKKIRLSEFAVRVLVCMEELANSEDAHIRASALVYLCILKPDRTPRILELVLKDPESELKDTATTLLAHLITPDALAILRKLLSSKTRPLQISAALAICARFPGEVDNVLDTLQERNDEKAVLAMIAILDLIEFRGRTTAGARLREAILKRREDSTHPIWPRVTATQKDRSSELERSEPEAPAAATLLEMLEDPDEMTRFATLFSMRGVREPSLIEPLIRLTRSSIRAEADMAMERLWALTRRLGLDSPPPEPPAEPTH